MAIDVGKATGNISHNNKNISEVITNASNNATGSVGAAAKEFFSGKVQFTGESLAGIDEANLGTFISAVESYRDGVQEIIRGFDESASLQDALKGDVATSFSGFLASLKTLMNAYVQAIDIEIKDIKEAAENYKAAAGSVSSDESADSDAISSAASSVSID